MAIGRHRDPTRGYPLRLDDGPRRPDQREEPRGIVRAAEERAAARVTNDFTAKSGTYIVPFVPTYYNIYIIYIKPYSRYVPTYLYPGIIIMYNKTCAQRRYCSGAA